MKIPLRTPNAVLKRERARPPRIETLAAPKGRQFPAGRMLIASPLAVAKAVQAIPLGRVLRMPELREELAREYGADYACPLSTGIFLRIAAEAAEEEGSYLPWWRVVDKDGKPMAKLPGGPAEQRRRLAAEGSGKA
jgi:alkylated DNA nucleotide flippase Atl1